MKRFFLVVLVVGGLIGSIYWLGEQSRRTPISSSSAAKEEKGGKAERPGTTTFTPETKVPVLESDVPLLDRINQEYIRVTQSVLPSVVNVSTSKKVERQANPFGDDPFGFPFPFQPAPRPGGPQREFSLGSGVIISREGHLVTNAHVVKDATEIKVELWDGRKLEAKLIGLDEPADIAVLKVEADDLKALPWGDSEKVQVGEQVLAIGNPFGLSESVSNGIVSAKGRNPGFSGNNNYEDFLQTTAAINPGNSGGALVNIRGELIGINTAIISRSGGFQGIGFAIPSNLARFALDSLIKSGKVVRGYLGVTIQDIKPELKEMFNLKTEEGALVTEVSPKTPAAEGGIKRGDVIVEFNSQKVKNPTQLRLAVSQTPVGKEVPVMVIRDGVTKELTLKVAEKPVDLDLGSMGGDEGEPAEPGDTGALKNVLAGIQVQNIDASARRQLGLAIDVAGVIVTQVQPDSVASGKLQPGDIIQELKPKGEAAMQKITDVKSFLALAKKIGPKQDVLLFVRRQKASTYLILKPES
jgi:serine protease Do